MRLQKEQAKHLELNSNGDLEFIDNGNVTKEERNELIEIDSDYITMYGEHFISNYEELTKKTD